MIYILKIGYQAYVLPNNRGLSTVMETLSRARTVEKDDRWDGGGITTKEKGVECVVECVPDYSFTARKRGEVIEPEVMPRDRTGGVGVEVRRLALAAGGSKAIAGAARRMIGDGQ